MSTPLSTDQRIEQLEQTVARLEKLLLRSLPIETNTKTSKWMSEAETMKELNLKRSSLFNLRASGVLRYSTASGKKIKYWREDVEKYLLQHSNVKGSK